MTRMSTAFQWKLHFQSGVLTGRELYLPRGELTIGGTSQCDIFVPDIDADAGELCTLRVDETSVMLQAAGRCKVNGRAVKKSLLGLRPGQKIDIGNCQFILMRLGDAVTAAMGMGGSRHALMTCLGIVALSLTVLLSFTLLYDQQGLQAATFSRGQFELSHYQQALNRTPGLADVLVTREPGGILTLAGWCRDTETLTPFLNQLIETGIAYRNQVICEDALIQNVTYLLHTRGYRDSMVTSGEVPGTVVITGDIAADSHWAAVSHQLKQLAGLRSWTVSNETDREIYDFVSLLREPALLPHLSIVREGEILMVTGLLSTSAQQKLQQVLTNWQRRNHHMRVVYQNIPAPKLDSSIFPAQMISFSGTSNNAFLQLANGMKIQAGSALPSGYRVTRLNQNGLELRRGGEWLHFPLDAWDAGE
jgi:type III secretion protein D